MAPLDAEGCCCSSLSRSHTAARGLPRARSRDCLALRRPDSMSPSLPPLPLLRCCLACEEEPSISLDRGMAGGATAGREVGGVMGRVGTFDGPAAQSPTSPHVCPRCARASALRERLFRRRSRPPAVERASSLSRAEAATPSVMACRDPAPAQTPRYRGASAHVVHAAADSRNPPGVGLSRQVSAVHVRPSLCQSRWGICAAILHPSATDWAYACSV